jgi:uncharacterized protein YjhX (UPF0386 family)
VKNNPLLFLCLGFLYLCLGAFSMNISKNEQRILHALAQGGRIILEKDESRKIIAAYCVTREGWYIADFDVKLFKRLKHRRFISSKNSGSYRITRHGLKCVRAQLNNR